MRPRDVKAVLASMTILVDTREQDTERARRRYATFGLPVRRAVLDYGDYAVNATLPDGSMILDETQRVHPTCAVERKMNLDELAECFTHSRERFTAEFERAAADGAKIWLLTESASWEALISGRYKSRTLPKAYLGSLLAFANRYNAQIVFCNEYSTGILIREILARDLKDRLLRGDYG